MNDKTTLQNQLESFKSQMKEINESLYKLSCEFEKEKAKIEKLRHSFFVVVKLINFKAGKFFDDNRRFFKRKQLS